MSERWKPEIGQAYWVVDLAYSKKVRPSSWANDYIDNNCYSCNNCFKTEDEAEAAAEKVKALLLSLHEPTTNSSQLPKLTAEVFDRPDCPEWAKYAAVSKFGCLTFFEVKPVLGNNSFLPLSENHTTKLYRNDPGRWDASDWQHSLIESPAKLPDWCKVGEFVWVKSAESYEKITEISGTKIATKHLFWEVEAIGKTVFQARLRPHNAQEMRALVGKVIDHKESGDRILVFGYDGDDNTVETINFFITATQLLNEYTIDGKPCGVFEHLDNGEWVE